MLLKEQAPAYPVYTMHTFILCLSQPELPVSRALSPLDYSVQTKALFLCQCASVDSSDTAQEAMSQ